MPTNSFMQRAIELSAQNLHERCGGPFGAVIVKDGEIVGEGYNHVVKHNDPTAHGEVMAIRDACQRLGRFDLSDCEIYTSCEPCPMCFGAIHRARIQKIRYANTEDDATDIGFDDELFRKDIKKDLHQRSIPAQQIMHPEAKAVFQEWKGTVEDIKY